MTVDPGELHAAAEAAIEEMAAGNSGAGLLGELYAALVRYVILPSPEAADAVTLYIAATHAQPAWEHATRLVVKSPLKRCGKTRLLEVVRETSYHPIPTANISPAALARCIDSSDPPTLIVDEADALFRSRRGELTEAAEAIRGLLNSGHSRGWPYTRWDAANRRLETVPTYAMAVLAAIGDLPDTIEDRAVVIAMRRRAPGEAVTQWRTRRTVPVLRDLRDRLREWVVSVTDQLGEAEPDLPVEDRAADVWEPLVAVADAAGGSWPERARHACKSLIGAADDDPDSASERLLADLRDVFGGSKQLSSETILERLAAIEEGPWAGWHRGEKLSPRGLAGLLRPYGIRSRNIAVGTARPKGYLAGDMADAWSRYSRYAATDPASAQARAVADGGAEDGTVAATRVDQPKLDDVAGVAAVAERRLRRANPLPVECPSCGRPVGERSPKCSATQLHQEATAW